MARSASSEARINFRGQRRVDDTVASLSSGYFTAFSDVSVGLMVGGGGGGGGGLRYISPAPIMVCVMKITVIITTVTVLSSHIRSGPRVFLSNRVSREEA